MLTIAKIKQQQLLLVLSFLFVGLLIAQSISLYLQIQRSYQAQQNSAHFSANQIVEKIGLKTSQQLSSIPALTVSAVLAIKQKGSVEIADVAGHMHIDGGHLIGLAVLHDGQVVTVKGAFNEPLVQGLPGYVQAHQALLSQQTLMSFANVDNQLQQFYVQRLMIDQQAYYLAWVLQWSPLALLTPPDAMEMLEVFSQEHGGDLIYSPMAYASADVQSEITLQLTSRQVLIQQHVDDSHWDIVTIKNPLYWRGQVMTFVLPKMLMLFVYLVIALTCFAFLNISRSRQSKKVTAFSEKSHRAEQALSCIDEVVITTSVNGKIIFCNRSAGKWLGNKSVESVIGKSIQRVFPFPGMPWLDRWRSLNKNGQFERHGETLVDFNGCLLTLDISQHYSKTDTGEASIIWVLRDISRQAADRDLIDLNRARYQALYDGSGVGMWHVDISLVRAWLANITDGDVQAYLEKHPNDFMALRTAFHMMDVNEAALAMHNAGDKQEFLSGVQNLFKRYNKSLMVKMAQKIASGESKFSFEVDFKNLNGNRRFYLVNVTLDVVGQDQALLSFLDINDRIQAERAVKESEKFWADVIRTLPDTVYVNDITSKETLYNSRHIGEMLGYTGDELKRIKQWRDLIHEDDIRQTDSALRELNNKPDGTVNEITARLKHHDGSWRIVRFRNCIFTRNIQEVAQYYVGIARDITEEEDAKILLSYSERRYRLLTEGISDIVFSLDAKLQLNYISSSVTKVLSFEADQVMREGLSVLFYAESYRSFLKLAKQDIAAAVKTGLDNVRLLDLNVQHKNGRPIILEVQSSILRNEAGEIEGLLASCREVTQRREIEKELLTAAEVFENTSEAIVVTSQEGGVSKVNKAFTQLTGMGLHDFNQADPTEYIRKSNSPEVLSRISNDLLIEGYWQGELNYRNRFGDVCPSWTGITALKDELGKVQSHIIISSDISDRKISEARIEHLAYYDPLTGLPNRSQMHETLERLILESEYVVALLFIDLDRFKPINDTMGHPAGDKVLIQVAQRLNEAVNKQDLVARIGGDEFTVIISGMKDTPSAVQASIDVSERILHQMMQPFSIDDRQLYLSASVGVALFPENALSGMDLLRNADTAMYHAKAMGKNNFQFYAEDMNRQAMERLELENHLHLAMSRNEFELFYQVQWNTELDQICGVEALLRWRRPHHGLVGPDKFIPIIEETGLIVPIGEWVLKAACDQINDWQDAGFIVPKLSVNLSARQFKDPDMLQRICSIVDETGVDPELIELELTESLLMDDVDRTLAVLNEARKMGFHLSIDDFGTGYSSLSYLKQFPVNNLKIDQSFIRNLPYNQEDAQITRTIVAMANNLGLGVIAEGVETAEQGAFLHAVGCHQVQGFLYSRPISADEMARDFLEADNEVFADPLI